MKTSAKERRKNFNPRKWASKWLKTSPFKRPYLDDQADNINWEDVKRRAKKNLMSNADRRARGFPEDPGLPDYQGEKNENNSRGDSSKKESKSNG